MTRTAASRTARPGPRLAPVSVAFVFALAMAGASPLSLNPAHAGDDDRAPAVLATPDPATARPWTVTRRTISQFQGEGQLWQIDYQLRNDGPETRVLTPDAVTAEVEGWVSNSRVADHATPRPSRLAIRGPWACESAELIASRDPARRCRERATLHLWSAPDGPRTPEPPAPAWLALALPIGPPPVVVPPGDTLRVRLCLEHEHFLYGPYEPLLGPRSLVLHLGPAVLRDRLPLDQELRPERSVPGWPQFEPPADHLDNHVFLTAPDSLHLAAHQPGCSSYRLTGPIRYATRMRLSFWYLVAPGTEGDVKARLTQHKQGPGIWRSLHDGDQDHYLSAVGRWTRVDRVFHTEPESTVLTLEFKLTGDIGELWIDNIVLEPIGVGPVGP